jgi:ribonuclease J
VSAPVFNVLDGAGVIGGTKILVRSGKANLLLDFGTNFSLWNSYFEEYLKPRSSRGLLDAVELNLLPPIPSLYRQELVPPGIDPWDRDIPADLQKLQIDAILVTHAHLDHCGYLSYVRQDVPIVSMETTALLMKAIQDTSRSDLEKEICYCVPREERNGVLRSVDYRKGPARQRQFLTLDSRSLSTEAAGFWSNALGSRALVASQVREVREVAGLRVLSIPVDHSIPGCTAFALETEEGWLVYTGDVRLHGAKGDLTRRFAEGVSRLKPKILFCEGTRVTRLEEEVVTEAEVRARAMTVVKGTPGLVIADFGSRNLERLLSFRDIAFECGRQLVLMTKDIHLLNAYHLATGEGPDPGPDPVLLLYQEEKASESTADRYLLDVRAQVG